MSNDDDDDDMGLDIYSPAEDMRHIVEHLDSLNKRVEHVEKLLKSILNVLRQTQADAPKRVGR